MCRHGVTTAGTQRWRCPACATTAVRRRPDAREIRFRQSFVRWVCGTKTLTEIADECRVERRTLTRRFGSFLNTPPTALSHTNTDAVLVLDAIWLGGRSAVALIARTPAVVRSWGFAPAESYDAWGSFVATLRKPSAVVVDGNGGLLTALRRHFEGVLIQRCMAHVMRFGLGKLTAHPATRAGQCLRELLCALPQVRTRRRKRRWMRAFRRWERTHRRFLGERSYYEQGNKRRWWYTHRSLRAVRSHIHNALPHLFTYVHRPWIPRTSNHLEGGTNARIEELIGRHRGMPLEHRKALVAYFLYSKTKRKNTRNVS